MTARRRLAWLAIIWLLAPTPLAADSPALRLDALGDSLPAQATHRFGTARFCTFAEVASLTLSADGKLLAAADREGRCYLWNASTGKPRLLTRAGVGKRVALSPDSQWLAVGDEFPFSVRNLLRNDLPRLQLGDGPRIFAFSPDSKTLATSQAEENDLLLYDLENGKLLRRFAGLAGNIAALAFSPDGKLLAAAAPPGDEENASFRIVVWDAVSGEKRKELTVAAKQLHKLVFLPDNKTLISQLGPRLAAWDVVKGERLPAIKRTVGAAFALDEKARLLAMTEGPQLVDFATGKVIHEFEVSTLVRHLSLSADGKRLAASPARFDSASPRLLVWDLSAEEPQSLADRIGADAHRHYVDAVAFSHDGKKIATASNVEGMARVWDARTSKPLHTFNLDSLAAKRSGGPHERRTLHDGLAFSADRAELFVAGQRWNLTTGQPIPLEADDDFRFEQTNSYRAILTPDGRRAASFLGDHSILFWNPAKGESLRKIEPGDKKNRGEWFAFAFAPDGKQAVSGKWFPLPREGDDTLPEDTIHLWDIGAGKRVKSMRRSRWPLVRLMLSPDGETLAVVGLPTRLELWHLPTGRLMREMILADGEDVPRSLSLATVAFAPHGQWLAFTHREGAILLLETHTGKEIQTLQSQQGIVNSLAFSPDGRSLLSGGRDTTALLWSLLPSRPKTPASWKDAEKLWQELGGPTDRAYPVVFALAADPARAVEVLSKRLQPDAGVSDKEIRALIANLSAAKFGQRDQAIRRLKEIGTRSFAALEDALKNAPDLETTRRIQDLLRTVETSLTPQTLRDLRGMQILELAGTPEAAALLAEIACGDRAAAKTRLAQAALDRLGKSR